ncbi:MAG: hypothetical protein SWX82_08725 [Cyanobacteriota bacterium]|nr:hypothetical protein [Cyanobacteriota bacterium]
MGGWGVWGVWEVWEVWDGEMEKYLVMVEDGTFFTCRIKRI